MRPPGTPGSCPGGETYEPDGDCGCLSSYIPRGWGFTPYFSDPNGQCQSDPCGDVDCPICLSWNAAAGRCDNSYQEPGWLAASDPDHCQEDTQYYAQDAANFFCTWSVGCTEDFFDPDEFGNYHTWAGWDGCQCYQINSILDCDHSGDLGCGPGWVVRDGCCHREAFQSACPTDGFSDPGDGSACVRVPSTPICPPGTAWSGEPTCLCLCPEGTCWNGSGCSSCFAARVANLQSRFGTYHLADDLDGVRYRRSEDTVPPFDTDVAVTDNTSDQGPALAQSGNRRLLLAWIRADESGSDALEVVSDDDGDTWAEETTIFPGATQCALAIDPFTGMELRAGLVDGEVLITQQWPGDELPGDEIATGVLLDDVGFSLACAYEGARRWLLAGVLDGEVVNFASADDGENWLAL